MDGLNNAVVPGYATPEQYTKEITITNDDIVDQSTVYAYVEHSFTTIEQFDRWSVKFEKDANGGYAMRKVHQMGTYVLPVPGGTTSRRCSTASSSGRGWRSPTA